MKENEKEAEKGEEKQEEKEDEKEEEKEEDKMEDKEKGNEKEEGERKDTKEEVEEEDDEKEGEGDEEEEDDEEGGDEDEEEDEDDEVEEKATPNLPQKSCPRGFQVEEGRCKDIDECLIDNNGCSHQCVNTPGSAYCQCPEGWILPDGARICQGNHEFHFKSIIAINSNCLMSISYSVACCLTNYSDVSEHLLFTSITE